MANKRINELTSRTPSLTDLMIVGDPSTGYSFKATLNTLMTFVGNNLQFSSLGGISLTNPANGQVLQFNGTSWVNYSPTNWNTAYDRSLVSVGVSGTTTKTITLTKQDGSTLTATWTEVGGAVTSVFGRTGAIVATEGDYSLTQLSDVTLSSPTTNQVLQYNGSAWVNATFIAGINSLNGLTATTQTFATGTSGTDFSITSTTSTHTFNLPTASATNRGALSSADWSTFNSKQNAITLTTTGNSGAATLVGATLNIPTYTLSGLGGVPTSRTLTINGTAFDLSADRSWTISGGVTGSGTTNYISKWTSSSALGNSIIFDNGTNVLVGTTTDAGYKLDAYGDVRARLGTNESISFERFGASDSRILMNKSKGGSYTIALVGGGLYLQADSLGQSIEMPSGILRLGTFGGVNSEISLAGNSYTKLAFGGFEITRTSDFYIYGVGSYLFNINGTSGNITINGQTDAGYKLDVNGTGRYQTNSGTVLQIGNTTASSVSNPANINLGGTYGITPGNVNNIKLAILDVGTPSILYGIGVSANTLEIHSQSDFAFYNGVATTRTKLINISSTGYTLDVNGTGRYQTNSGTVLQIGSIGGVAVSNPANINLGGTYGNNTPGNVNNIKLAILDIGSPSNLYGIGISANLLEFHSQSDFAFYNGISTNRTERMRITSGGDVGIGTTSPAYKLDVTGDIRSTTSAYFATSSGSVGINTTSVNAASLLQMDSTTKGFLPPRMTNAQMVAIGTPPAGLVVYDTTNNKLNVYDGSNWVAVH